MRSLPKQALRTMYCAVQILRKPRTCKLGGGASHIGPETLTAFLLAPPKT